MTSQGTKQYLEQKKKENVTNSSVSVMTWGTHRNGGNGMAHFLDSEFFGANTGHASVLLTFPADEQGKDLINKYCYRDGKRLIPFTTKLHRSLDKDNLVVTQEVYCVYFSWWLDELASSPSSDSESERLGANVLPIAPDFVDPTQAGALDPSEKRIYRGLLGSRLMTLSSKQVIHNLQLLNKNQRLLLSLERETSEYEDTVEYLETIKIKLYKSKKSGQPLKITKPMSLWLDKHIPEWKEITENSEKVPLEKIKLFTEKIKRTRRHYKKKGC